MATYTKAEQKRRDELERKVQERAKNRADVMDLIRAEAGLDLSEENIKLPIRYNKGKIANYTKKAKAAYYKRNPDKPTSLKRQVIERANAIGLNHKYIKMGRTRKNANTIISEAVARKEKEEKKKTNTTQKRTSKKQMLIQGVKNAALAQNIVLNDANIKIPVAATMDDVPKLTKTAMGRYYKRVGATPPSHQAILDKAAAMGIDAKYVKFLRSYTTEEQILEAAAKRAAKNGVKVGKSALRDQILSYAEAIGKTEAEVRSAICVRKKA